MWIFPRKAARVIPSGVSLRTKSRNLVGRAERLRFAPSLKEIATRFLDFARNDNYDLHKNCHITLAQDFLIQFLDLTKPLPLRPASKSIRRFVAQHPQPEYSQYRARLQKHFAGVRLCFRR